MIMLDDLEPSGLPGKWHSHSPFAVVNPKMTGAFETAAGFGRSESGAARMRTGGAQMENIRPPNKSKTKFNS